MIEYDVLNMRCEGTIHSLWRYDPSTDDNTSNTHPVEQRTEYMHDFSSMLNRQKEVSSSTTNNNNAIVGGGWMC